MLEKALRLGVQAGDLHSQALAQAGLGNCAAKGDGAPEAIMRFGKAAELFARLGMAEEAANARKAMGLRRKAWGR